MLKYSVFPTFVWDKNIIGHQSQSVNAWTLTQMKGGHISLIGKLVAGNQLKSNCVKHWGGQWKHAIRIHYFI